MLKCVRARGSPGHTTPQSVEYATRIVHRICYTAPNCFASSQSEVSSHIWIEWPLAPPHTFTPFVVSVVSCGVTVMHALRSSRSFSADGHK